MKDMHSLLSTFRTALESFASSPSAFQVLRSIPSEASNRSLKTLYVLDSSFNPPTKAHLRIATSAVVKDRRAQSEPTRHLLLLLATQNADKAPKPASFEQRLVMMSIFAEDLIRSVREQENIGESVFPKLVVDVGITKSPLYLDKASVIDQSGRYGKDSAGPEQVHLTGFDSLIRLFDTKYYPRHSLQSLESLFSKHRIRATRRTGDEWGGRDEQDAYMEALSNGDRDQDGANKEWASKIDLVDGRSEGEEVISSTKVRDAAKRRDGETLGRFVTERVKNWILDQDLYLDE